MALGDNSLLLHNLGDFQWLCDKSELNIVLLVFFIGALSPSIRRALKRLLVPQKNSNVFFTEVKPKAGDPIHGSL